MTESGTNLLTFQFDSFRKLPLIHGMSGRQLDAPAEGNMAYNKDFEPADVSHNRKAFFAELGLELPSLTLGKQVHGTRVVPVLSSDRGRGLPPKFDGFPDTDGLVTGDLDVTLGIIIGDCVPILLYDPRKHVVGLVHAGWRGTVGLIARQAVQIMSRGYGCRSISIIAGIGPSIGPARYEVGQEVIDAWMANRLPHGERAVIQRDGKLYFDLWTANRLALQSAGISRWNIEDAATCTMTESDRFFSRRAFVAGEASKGSQMMVVQLKAKS